MLLGDREIVANHAAHVAIDLHAVAALETEMHHHHLVLKPERKRLVSAIRPFLPLNRRLITERCSMRKNNKNDGNNLLTWCPENTEARRDASRRCEASADWPKSWTCWRADELDNCTERNKKTITTLDNKSSYALAGSSGARGARLFAASKAWTKTLET